MSKAGKLVKDMLKAKKESVMGKLGDSPYEDPMEPWSAKYAQPVKEEAEQLDESDPLLFKYIRSLGYNPEQMDFATRSKYARSNAFKNYKISHMNDQLKTEEVEDINEADSYGHIMKKAKEAQKSGDLGQYHKHLANYYHQHAQEARFDSRHSGGAGSYLKNSQKSKMHSSLAADHGVNEEVEELDEAGTGLLMSFIKAKGLNPLSMDGNQKKSYSRSSEFRIFKSRHVKEISGMGERGDDWNEEKKQVKEEVSYKPSSGRGIKTTAGHTIVGQSFNANGTKHSNIVKHGETGKFFAAGGSSSHPTKATTFHDSPEDAANSKKSYVKEGQDKGEYDYEGAMAKTLLQTICRNAEALKDMLEDDENLPEWVQSKITKAEDYITTSLDYMKSTEELDEEVEQIEELDKKTLDSYITKVATGPSRGMTQKGTLKSIKAIGGVTTALRKKAEKPITELKNQDDNQELDSHITREDLRKWFSKTDPEGDWKRINSKGEVAGPCAREPGEPKPKCMSKEKRAELSKSERAAAVATKRKHDPVADRAGKGGKPINVSNYGKGKLGEETEQIDEKNKPTNPALWSRAKSMARSKFDVYPSAYANGWASKWYKSKGGGWKSVSEDTVQEGIGGIEDSPMSATNSVKAMESEHRKKNMKSARIIKSIYKKKGKNESIYDWEKDDKPNAKVTLQGGTTMTGKPRDTVEIEPVLKTRPNSQKQ